MDDFGGQISVVDDRTRNPASSCDTWREVKGLLVKCRECGAETADVAQVCVRCGAPVTGQWSEAANSVAGVVSDRAGPAVAAAPVAGMAGQAPPGPYVPGRGKKVPARIRRVRRGYSRIAWGAIFGGWASVMVGGYFSVLNTSYPAWWFFAGLALWVLAAILFGQRIRLSRFLRRPSDASRATVTACRRGGRTLMLDAPADGHPYALKVRLAWWAEPEVLLPGERVTFYGRPGGVGRLLMSSPAQDRAFVGTGRRWPGPPAGEQAVQDAPHQLGSQRAGRRYLRWGPLVIAGLGFVVAVAATLITAVPSLTGHLSEGELRPGDCLTGSNLGLGTGRTWPYMVAAVRCTDQHLAEVVFSGNAWPQSPAPYPGDYEISDEGYARCLIAYRAYVGIGITGSSFQIDMIAPSGGDDWASGDRHLVCMAYQPGVPVNYSIKGRGV